MGLVDVDGRDIYVFDEEGNFSHIISDGTDKARGYLMKNESHDAILFDFADPINDPCNIKTGNEGFDRVQIITDEMIDNALWNASVYEQENRDSRYMFALLQSSVQDPNCEKGINGKLDFYATANMDLDRRHWMHKIADPCDNDVSFLSVSPNVLFLTKTPKGWYAHNDHNLGNFLWGAAMDALGFWEITARIGAHIQNRFLSNEQKAKKEWDSPDDQFSISLGYDWYNNYKKGK